MSLKQISRKEGVVQLSTEATVRDACRLMEDRNVGCVVITQHGRPVGILTDRDVILRAVRIPAGRSDRTRDHKEVSRKCSPDFQYCPRFGQWTG